MLAAVLFDYDGTLMDTEPAILASYMELFRRYRTAAEFTPARQVEVLGPSLASEMVRFFPEQDPAQMVQEYRDFQNAHLSGLIRPMPHVRQLLDSIRDLGIPMGLVSTRFRASMISQLEMFGMRPYFQVVIGHDQVTAEKPDPEGIRMACSQLGLDPAAERILYVGDSPTDIGAGHHAGTVTAGIVSNPKKRQVLQDAGPDYLVDDLSELIDIIESLFKEENKYGRT